MRTTAGSEFHSLGAATENARLPVDVLNVNVKCKCKCTTHLFPVTDALHAVELTFISVAYAR